MQIKYRDPYEPLQEVVIPDGDPEALKEVLEFCNNNARLIQNAERRERYHTPYHLEGWDYESSSIAYHDDPEHIVIRKEEAECIRAALSKLSATQRRRLLMRYEGFSYRQIAEADGVSVNAIKECLDAAKKKFLKYF